MRDGQRGVGVSQEPGAREGIVRHLAQSAERLLAAADEAELAQVARQLEEAAARVWRMRDAALRVRAALGVHHERA